MTPEMKATVTNGRQTQTFTSSSVLYLQLRVSTFLDDRDPYHSAIRHELPEDFWQTGGAAVVMTDGDNTWTLKVEL